MPTLDELTTSVFRDLADEAQAVFTDLQVQDFIRGGIAELNRIAPPETTEDIDLVQGTYEYATTISLPYDVELRDSVTGMLMRLAEPEPNTAAFGQYRFRQAPGGGIIELPPAVVEGVAWEESGAPGSAVPEIEVLLDAVATTKAYALFPDEAMDQQPYAFTFILGPGVTDPNLRARTTFEVRSSNGVGELQVLGADWVATPIEVADTIVNSRGFTGESQGGGGRANFRISEVFTITEPPEEFVSNTHLHIGGYGKRPLPVLGADETGLNDEEAFAVRAYAKSEGFDLLTHDRSLFGQWQGQTNNTDVSPVMIMNMAMTAKNQWDRTRGHVRTVRRYW